MTSLERLRKIASRVTMVNSPIAISSVSISELEGDYHATISVLVPDRESGTPRAVFHTRRIYEDYEEAMLLDVIREMTRNVFNHEWAEAFHVDGVRVHDPHKYDDQ